ncbi:hypothetical protein FJW08_03265 [Mesorhizobium sp. B3-2-1]|uniref:hypothetical protein n=1 Tax=Mesorhizobium sp. B3-2-1 TaxID=2589891 RepID=UPI001127167D|nr:hypothetical protein [Mesorhizobium sp. B3-2-1]TPI34613.1 hypothetical protein FJW08_03265 [Mesorhizobium sp. B3-2-1]
MAAITSVSSTAMAVLSLISAKQSHATGAKTAPGLNPLSARSMSPAVSDAILRIQDLVKGQQATKPQSSDGGMVGYSQGRITKISDLPAAHAEKVKALGADAVVQMKAPQISDEAFQAMMLEHSKANFADLPGFNEAAANGTLKIQRASDVPELGLGSVQYTLYKDGQMIGGAGFSAGTFNKSLYLDIQSQGVRQATGSINGQDYYVTWADPTLATA